MGLNYAIPPSKPNKCLLESAINIERRLQKIDENNMNELTKNSIRGGVAQIIKSNKFKVQIQPLHFKKLHPSIKSLQNDKSIVILPADKGNCTVVMDREEYDVKCTTMLNDTDTYLPLSIDPTRIYEKKVLKECLNLKKANKLSEAEYKTIITKNATIPHFYGLPKIHKPDVPLRPIVDFKNSPSYGLASHLSKILITLSKKKHAVKNSYEFVEQVKSQKIKAGYIMASFDVVSLFTKVSQEHTISYIKRRLREEDKWKEITKLSEDDIISLLKLCLKCSYFKFRNKIYHQKDGVPMGSPVSPIFAELFMESLEGEILPNPFIQFWKRFVDDTFAIIKGRKSRDILQKLNTFHENIKFTTELEENNKITFLDVCLEVQIGWNIESRSSS